LSNRLIEAGQALGRRDYAAVQALCLAELQADPGSAEACSLLALVAADHRNFAKAAEMFAEAVRRAPHNSRYHANLARALADIYRPAEARQAAERAAELAGDDAASLSAASDIFTRLGLFPQALAAAERAAAAQPGDGGQTWRLASVRQFSGDLAGAAQAYRRMLAIDPGDHRAYWSLVQLEKQTAEHGLAEPMRARFEAAGGEVEPSLFLGHALAKTCEDMGENARALDWLLRAKAGRRAAQPFDEAADDALFAAAARPLPPREGFASDAPIFIVGLPRTGTTLVDRIVSSHPDVVSAGERTELFYLVKQMGGSRTPLMIDADALDRARNVDFARLGRDYVAAARPVGAPQRRFTDKAPMNFLYAGIINRALPEARIVCLRRHPMDACLSIFRQLFALNQPFYDYAYDLATLARHYARFDRLMAHWRAVLPPGRFTEIAYEDLVADQEGQTRRLLDFCGLDWDPACLDFHENTAAVATASSVQVRQPLYASSVGRWRRYGEGLGPLAEALEAAGVGAD
jgi:tetratricopeptide (TPR) repeat protein